MSIYKQYKTNPNSENQGVRIDKGSNEDGSKIAFFIARSGKSNTAYKLAAERAFKPHRAQIKSGTLSEDASNDLLLDLFCGHVLKGWENVRDENDVELTFNLENARKLMKDLPDLHDELLVASNDSSLFLDSNRESAAKN